MKAISIIFGIIFLCACPRSETNKTHSREKHEQENNLKKNKEQNPKERKHKDFVTNCHFDQLSKQFDVKLNVNFIYEDSAKINVIIIDKKTNNTIDSINIYSEYLMLPWMFGSCENVMSLTTGFNKEKEVVDNSPGDLIVADFNFDGLDDFAVAIDNGGNGGYIYQFYLQHTKGKFVIDKFLSEEMLRFPVTFDKKLQTLMTSVHANAYENCEIVYQLTGNDWRQISKKFVK